MGNFLCERPHFSSETYPLKTTSYLVLAYQRGQAFDESRRTPPDALWSPTRLSSAIAPRKHSKLWVKDPAGRIDQIDRLRRRSLAGTRSVPLECASATAVTSGPSRANTSFKSIFDVRLRSSGV